LKEFKEFKEFESVVKKMKSVKAKRVFVQFPEGLKLKIQKIADDLENEGFEIVLCMERVYGGCDIREDEARRLKCDTVLHIAHEDFGVKTKLPVIYWDYFIDADPLPALEKEFYKMDKYKKIGIVTSLQFAHVVPKVERYLKSHHKEVFVHSSLKFPGQMLGCRVEAGLVIEKKVDAFLCISAGKFYPLGLAIATNKPVLNLDLEKQQIHDMAEQKKRMQKIIEWNKSQLKEARNVGLLVSWKQGQMFGNPSSIKQQLKKQGKKVYMLAIDEFSNDKIEGLKLDFLINLCCPRIATDDLERTKIPLVNWHDIYRHDKDEE